MGQKSGSYLSQRFCLWSGWGCFEGIIRATFNRLCEAGWDWRTWFLSGSLSYMSTFGQFLTLWTVHKAVSAVAMVIVGMASWSLRTSGQREWGGSRNGPLRALGVVINHCPWFGQSCRTMCIWKRSFTSCEYHWVMLTEGLFEGGCYMSSTS